MARKTKKQIKLEKLEAEIKGRGVRLAYERLNFAGLVLKSGLCWFKGSYYLFIDRLLPPASRIELISGALEELDELAARGRLDRPGEPSENAREDAPGGPPAATPPEEAVP